MGILREILEGKIYLKKDRFWHTVVPVCTNFWYVMAMRAKVHHIILLPLVHPHYPLDPRSHPEIQPPPPTDNCCSSEPSVLPHVKVSNVWPGSAVATALLTLVTVLHRAPKLCGWLRIVWEQSRHHTHPLHFISPAPTYTHTVWHIRRQTCESVPPTCWRVGSDWLDALTLTLKCKTRAGHKTHPCVSRTCTYSPCIYTTACISFALWCEAG